MRVRVATALLRAGLPEKPYGFEARAADRLRHAELNALFLDRRTRERGMSPTFSWDYELIFEPDGTLAYTLSGPTPLAISGRWAIDGDTVCYRYDAVLMGRPYCVHIYRDAANPSGDNKSFVRADMFGIFRFRLEALEAR